MAAAPKVLNLLRGDVNLFKASPMCSRCSRCSRPFSTFPAPTAELLLATKQPAPGSSKLFCSAAIVSDKLSLVSSRSQLYGKRQAPPLPQWSVRVPFDRWKGKDSVDQKLSVVARTRISWSKKLLRINTIEQMKQSVPRNHFQSSMQFWQNRDARKAVWENSLAICLGIRTLADNDVKICWRLSLPSLASWTSLNFENTFEKYVCVSKMRLLAGDLFRIGYKNVTKLCLMQSTCFHLRAKIQKNPNSSTNI